MSRKLKYLISSAAAIFVAAGLGFLIWASADVDSGVYMDCLCKGPDDRPCVSLTFDDGPDEVMTPKVLDVLKKYDLKATFFLIGNKAEKNPEIVARMIDEGHIIGCHSWSHAHDFPFESPEEIYEEFSQCENLLYNLTGKMISLFRPPYGVTNPNIAEAVEKKDYTSIGWSIRSLDTDAAKDRDEIFDRIVKRLHNGAIILLHDRCDHADELLQLLISDLIQKEYNIVNLDEMLGIEPYCNEI